MVTLTGMSAAVRDGASRTALTAMANVAVAGIAVMLGEERVN
ncbi:MAG: hypothetical protein AAFQ35_03575 [Pseudomonadota bacterium]